MAYFWTKTFHLVFVIAWMATVFYLPRILVNLSETRGQPEVQARLVLMGRRLYGFGHNMFGIAVILGFLLWLGHKLSPEWWPDIVAGMKWMHGKLALVAALLAYYIVAGRWLKKAAAGGALPSPTTMRWFNELPLLFLVPLIYLVLAKPF